MAVWTAETKPRSPGRPKGVPNRVTVDIKHAVEQSGRLYAGELVDPLRPFHATRNPWRYPPGMVGALCRLRERNDAAWASLVRALIPAKIEADISVTHAMLVAAAGDFDAEAVQAALDVMRKKRAALASKPAAVIDVAPVDTGSQPAPLTRGAPETDHAPD